MEQNDPLPEQLVLRYDRRVYLVRIILFISIFIGFLYDVIYHSENQQRAGLVFFGIVAFVSFVLAIMHIIFIVENKPVITLDNNGIRCKERYWPWQQVQGYELKRSHQGGGRTGKVLCLQLHFTPTGYYKTGRSEIFILQFLGVTKEQMKIYIDHYSGGTIKDEEIDNI